MPNEAEERQRAEAMTQAKFQGEAIVHLKYLRESDSKQWDKLDEHQKQIGELEKKVVVCVEAETCEDHRKGLGRMNLLKVIGGLIALLGGIAGLIVILT